jgi:hypothetical protein
MDRRRTIFQVVMFLACLPASAALGQDKSKSAPAPAEIVTILPQETNELLANPGMGWETFGRTRDKDKNLSDWIPSTVHYERWGWGVLEPRPGEIDYAFLDKVLAESRAAGQRLAFRVMCCSTSQGQPYHPDWLEKVGGKVLTVDYEGRDGFRVPDLDDVDVLARHLHLIQRLGARCDGHPDLDHVDLGSIGWWGEWHMSGSKAARMPAMETRKQIIDAYVKAFRKTPLLMLIGDSECLTYAVKHGTGWRADCLGDMGGFSKNWYHMRDAYPHLVRDAGIGEAWKTAPVAWETCWDMRRWVKEDWSLRFILNYALALHGSYLNNKSAPLPADEATRPEIERFLRRLGYRMVLKEVRHPKQAAAGTSLAIETKWQNVGSAPCYRPYRVAYRLSNERGYAKVLPGAVTANKWMPGSIATFTKDFFQQVPDLPPGEIVQVVDRVSLPGDMEKSQYDLALGIVGENSTEPVVRLAIKGRAADGWYPLSKVTISE